MNKILRTPLRPLFAALLALGVAGITPPAAHAADPKTSLELMVAEVSTEGNSIDPKLSKIAADFKRNGLAFTNYRLVKSGSLSLAEKETGTLQVPGLKGGKVDVTLLKREPDGKVSVRVATGASASQLSIPPKGEAYLDAGAAGSKKLFVVVKR